MLSQQGGTGMLLGTVAQKISSRTAKVCSMLALVACLAPEVRAADPLTTAGGSQRGAYAASHDVSARDAEDSDDGRVQVVEKGTSSRAARKAALEALPLERMTAENRARAQQVLDALSLFRQLPTAAFEVDPDVYRFFINCPDAAVAIWKALGISKFQMRQTGPDQYEADAGDGTRGVVDVLLRSDEHNVILCDGVFASPLLAKPIQSTALLHLHTAFLRDEHGRPQTRHRLNMFVAFPSQTVETAAKLISPVSNMIVDRNFREVSLFVHLMSTAMVRQPGWVERIAGRMELHEDRRTEFLKLAAQVYVSARKREAAAAGEDVTLHHLLNPLRQPASSADATATDRSPPVTRIAAGATP
jgi:hypothetical protein